MTGDNDVGNSEEDGSATRMDKDKDVRLPNEKFLSKEPIVLVSIVCMSLMNTLSFYRLHKTLMALPSSFLEIYDLLRTPTTVVGIMFAAFLSEVTGRKLIYRYLFVLSVFLSILVVLSSHPIVLSVTILLRGIVIGASSLMNPLAISEYSSPKHRFTWFVLDITVYNIVIHTMLALPKLEILFYVLIVVEIVLGLICCGFTWVWPESPYWLANRGKLERSREAFLWLRGEGGRGEMAAVLQARRRPGPAKLFWYSLLVALATILVSTFGHLQVTQSSIFYWHFTTVKRGPSILIRLFATATISCTLAAVSYFVRRKLMFIVFSVTSFVLCYAEAIFMYAPGHNIDSVLYYLLHVASEIIQTSGPTALAANLTIEITPYKYNTTISCICYIVMTLSLDILLRFNMYLAREIFHPSALLALSTTSALGSAFLYYFFAPETKDKTLLEIQRSNFPDKNDLSLEQNQSMVLNVI